MDEVQTEEIDLRDYLRVVLKRRWTIITVFAVMAISVTIHAFTSTPVYEAATRLIIEKENPRFRNAVIEAMSMMNVEKIYKDAMHCEK